MKYFFPPAVFNRMQDWTYTLGAVFELLFHCWTLHEKCSVMESGTVNKFLLLDTKRYSQFSMGQFSIEHPSFLVAGICWTEFMSYLTLITVLIISGGSLLHREPGSRSLFGCSLSWMQVGLIQSFKEVIHSKTVGVHSSFQELAFFCVLYLYLVLKLVKIDMYISPPFNSSF